MAAVLAAMLAVPAAADAGEAFRVTDVARLAPIRDARLAEVSGIGWMDGHLLAVNDSGDGPVVYAVRPSDGTVVGTVTYSSITPRDNEALAVGPDRTVWVADVGDNDRVRPHVMISRFTLPAVPRGDVWTGAQQARFVYPDGPHDAEALMVDPATGEAFVVTKDITRGRVYRVPRRWSLDDPATLEPVATDEWIGPLVTDAAIDPAGGRAVLRTYGQAAVHAVPGLARAGLVDLPRERQGEAVTFTPDGALVLVSEGVGQRPVRLRITPREEPGHASTSASAADAPAATTPSPTTPEGSTGHAGWRRPAAAAAVALAGVLALLAAGARRRRRRRRGRRGRQPR